MNISSDKLMLTLSRGFHRFNSIIFIVLVAAAFGIIALALLGVTQTALDDTTNPAASAQSATFDKATIDRLSELQPSTEIAPPAPPPSNQRTNPFTEA